MESKSVIAAFGAFGLAIWQATQSDFASAVQSVLLGLGLLGVIHRQFLIAQETDTRLRMLLAQQKAMLDARRPD